MWRMLFRSRRFDGLIVWVWSFWRRRAAQNKRHVTPRHDTWITEQKFNYWSKLFPACIVAAQTLTHTFHVCINERRLRNTKCVLSLKNVRSWRRSSAATRALYIRRRAAAAARYDVTCGAASSLINGNKERAAPFPFQDAGRFLHARVYVLEINVLSSSRSCRHGKSRRYVKHVTLKASLRQQEVFSLRYF